MPNAPGMDQSEIDTFLASSKIPLRLGTTNSKGEPNIHPVWYHYANNKLYLMSYNDAVKVRNLKRNKTVYFSVDTDAMPNTGVKGRGTAIIGEDHREVSRGPHQHHGEEHVRPGETGLRGISRNNPALLFDMGLCQIEILAHNCETVEDLDNLYEVQRRVSFVEIERCTVNVGERFHAVDQEVPVPALDLYVIVSLSEKLVSHLGGTGRYANAEGPFVP